MTLIKIRANPVTGNFFLKVLDPVWACISLLSMVVSIKEDHWLRIIFWFGLLIDSFENLANWKSMFIYFLFF